MRRVTLLAVACITYLVAAWFVAPGFYDGFGPAAPYNFTCPPPQAGTNQKPSPGHADIKVVGGVSDASSAYTNDGQIVMGFLPGAFDATGKTAISVDITPTADCPKPSGVVFVTNVYNVTADAPLVKDANLTLVYSNLEPDPSDIYYAVSEGGPWTSIGKQSQGQLYTAWQHTRKFGYYAAGYAKSAPSNGPTIGGGQALPIIVALLIVIVVLAGVPLAVVRRRRGSSEPEEEDET